MNINKAWKSWKENPGDYKLEQDFISAAESMAGKLVYKFLGESNPDIVNECLYMALIVKWKSKAKFSSWYYKVCKAKIIDFQREKLKYSPERTYGLELPETTKILDSAALEAREILNTLPESMEELVFKFESGKISRGELGRLRRYLKERLERR